MEVGSFSEPRAARARILVVDDDPASLHLLEQYLTTQQFSVTACASSLDALQVFAAGRYQLVLTDMNMPYLDGLELLRRIRQQDTLVPALVLTSYGTLDNAVAAFREGRISNYLVRPLPHLEELGLAITQALAEAQDKKQRLMALARLSLLGNVAEQSEEPIFLCRLEGHILVANRQARELFCLPGRSLEGNSLLSLIPFRTKDHRLLRDLLSQTGLNGPVSETLRLNTAYRGRQPFTLTCSSLHSHHRPDEVVVVTCTPPRTAPAVSLPPASLSSREREITALVADGLSNREIAARLYISETTVKAHVSAALQKLGLESRVQLALHFLAPVA